MKFTAAAVAVLSVGAVLIAAPNADAAGPAPIHVSTPTAVVGYNGQPGLIRGSATPLGRIQVVSAALQVFKGTALVKSSRGQFALGYGDYTTVTTVTYRAYAVHRVTKLMPLTRDGLLVPATCTIVDPVAVNFAYDETCTSPLYPGQTATSWYTATATVPPVGTVADDTVDFQPQTVLVPQAVDVTSYSPVRRYVGHRAPLRVINGGSRYEFSGNGIKTTRQFHVTGDWTITYSYDCSNFSDGTGNFQIYVYRGSSLVDIAANALGSGSVDSTTEYGGGTYHLEMNSECDWDVIVS